MSKKQPIQREYSAGGAVYKRVKEPENERVKVLWLIIQPSTTGKVWRKGRWQIPKGWIDEGETGREAAAREVREEGGIEAKIVEKIGRVDVFFYNEDKQKVVKNIVFFLMEYKAGSEKNHDQETKEAVWLPYQEALERLTFKSERQILEKARKILEGKERQPKLL